MSIVLRNPVLFECYSHTPGIIQDELNSYSRKRLKDWARSVQHTAPVLSGIIKGMRVIAGSAKGSPLKVPKGTPTRPATELVRGALFSALESMDADWGRVLDLFSGSGSLGIEALSRGAGWVDFVDQERRCCDIIRENLGKARLDGSAGVHCMSVSRALSVLKGQYGVILMDPPYRDRTIGKVLEQIDISGLIAEGAPLFITHSALFKLEPAYGGLALQREYRHGDSVIALYRKEE
jgi:16S rRNA (guanine(966)-N(2))-methyltransferase RsmD